MNEDIKIFVEKLFIKYLSRKEFTIKEFNFHYEEIISGIKTKEQKEEEFRTCREREDLLLSFFIKKFKDEKQTRLDILYLKFLIKKLNFDENNILKHINKYGSRIEVAVCLSGHIRSSKNFINKNKENFYSILNPDIFIHTWDDVGLQNKENYKPKSEWLNSNSPKVSESYIRDVYRPKNMIMEKLSSKISKFSFPAEKTMFYFDGQAKDNASKYINGQLYSIHKSYELCQNFKKKYDIIIRLRFDFLFSTKINLESFFDQVYNIRINEKIMYIAHPVKSGHGHPGGGGGCKKCILDFSKNLNNDHDHTNDICDIMIITSQNSFKHYSNLYLSSEKIYDENSTSNISNIITYNIDYWKDGSIYYIKQFGDAIEKYIFCYYPEKLLRAYLRNNILLNDDSISGMIVR